jgi:ubiquinone/menaquinone biosynthesis C-methylase UbiE
MDKDEAYVYDKIAEEYYKNKKGLYPKNDLEKFLYYLSQGSSILDLGCGPGQASKIFCERKYLVTGLDFSEEMIKIGKKEIPNAKFILEDIRNLNKVFRNEMFEGAWACASLLHIPKKDIPSVFNQVYNVLKNQGVFYVSVKEGEGEKDLTDERYDNIKRHFSYFKKEEIISLLKESKFRPIYFSSNRRDYSKDPEHIWINFIAKK